MFCYIDPFIMNQDVVRLTPGSTEVIFHGTLGEISDFMVAEYANQEYDRITLKGTLAETVADQIRMKSKTNYNINDIKVEVLK